MVQVCVVLGLMSLSLLQADWTPPDNPDPFKILQEAQSDTRAGKYAVALAKHVWYHEHALEIQPSQRGVRLSFALGDWHELGKKYPPALQKMVTYRDAAREQFLSGKDAFETFHDLVALNKELGDEALTREVFLQLDAKHPEVAKSVYALAQPSLVKAKDYQICGKYLQPDKNWPKMLASYHSQIKYEAENKRPIPVPSFAEPRFLNSATTLIALLVQNQRKEEAQVIAEQARNAWDNLEFHKAIDDALKGVVPAPWP